MDVGARCGGLVFADRLLLLPNGLPPVAAELPKGFPAGAEDCPTPPPPPPPNGFPFVVLELGAPPNGLLPRG